MPSKKKKTVKRRYVLQSPMAFGAAGDTVSLDPTDLQVRRWLRAGNILKKGK